MFYIIPYSNSYNYIIYFDLLNYILCCIVLYTLLYYIIYFAVLYYIFCYIKLVKASIKTHKTRQKIIPTHHRDYFVLVDDYGMGCGCAPPCPAKRTLRMS